MDQLLLSPEEAAERLGCRRSFLFTLLRTGEVRSIKLGRLRRIPVRALEDYIEQRLAEPCGPLSLR
jgi:excisionase family DNA binding protein